MKQILIFIILLCFCIAVPAIPTGNPVSKTSFSGSITDKKNSEPLPGVSVYFPDLKTGTITDEKGYFRIDNLPAIKVLIQISIVGYKQVIETIDLSGYTEKNYELEYTATELNEVVVTGLSGAADLKHTPNPITIVSKSALIQNASANIIDALASQPGISQITTGTGISKPVIRGLGYNRVIVINDGVRQEGQQWGDEHGVELDEYSINKVEILKGPASLAYGSDALAGVINFLPAPALPEGKVEGALIANYQTNNGLTGYSADFSGNKKGWLWDMRYSGKMAHDYKNNFDGYVYNSRFRENAISGTAGVNKSWGYTRLTGSAYYLMPGLIEGERDSLDGTFIRPVAQQNGAISEEKVPEEDYKFYSPGIPFQKIYHYKLVSKSGFILGKSNLKTTFGFQQNRRQEFADILEADQYELYFLMNTLTYDIQYSLPERNGLNISAGINGMYQSSQNKGREYLVPEYHLFDAGVFTLLRKSLGDFDLSAGLRYDSRTETGEELFLDENGEKVPLSDTNAMRRFEAFRSNFTGISGSMGLTWQMSREFFSKINISRGYRAPNIAELASNGVHEGTMRYETGDPALKPETSIQLDYSLGYNTEHISAELSLFDSYISDFIYLHKLSSFAGGDSVIDDLNVFKFVSGKAHLSGGEIRIDVHPHPYDWLHIENAFSYVRSVQKGQPDSMKYLPFTPAPKYQCTLRFDGIKPGKYISNPYIQVGIDYYFAQKNVFEAFGTETETPSYLLLHAGIGANFTKNRKTLCSLYIYAGNLTDKAYQNHLNRLKYAPVNPKTGRSGVFDMGRNISFRLIVPIRFS